MKILFPKCQLILVRIVLLCMIFSSVSLKAQEECVDSFAKSVVKAYQDHLREFQDVYPKFTGDSNFCYIPVPIVKETIRTKYLHLDSVALKKNPLLLLCAVNGSRMDLDEAFVYQDSIYIGTIYYMSGFKTEYSMKRLIEKKIFYLLRDVSPEAVFSIQNFPRSIWYVKKGQIFVFSWSTPSRNTLANLDCVKAFDFLSNLSLLWQILWDDGLPQMSRSKQEIIQRLSSKPNIPKDIMVQSDSIGIDSFLNIGIDSSLYLNVYEGVYLNEIFKDSLNGFNFMGKKLGFINTSGKNGKISYFDMHKQHLSHVNSPCNNGTLYIFNAAQKAECGGYDAAIVYGNKRLTPIEEVVRNLKNKP